MAWHGNDAADGPDSSHAGFDAHEHDGRNHRKCVTNVIRNGYYDHELGWLVVGGWGDVFAPGAIPDFPRGNYAEHQQGHGSDKPDANRDAGEQQHRLNSEALFSGPGSAADAGSRTCARERLGCGCSSRQSPSPAPRWRWTPRSS
jgi:hypothetical protein